MRLRFLRVRLNAADDMLNELLLGKRPAVQEELQHILRRAMARAVGVLQHHYQATDPQPDATAAPCARCSSER